MKRFRLVAVGLVLRLLLAQGAECPPPGFDAVQNFNISEYISRPWYVLMQMPLFYQPQDDLFCVRARYEPLDASDLTAGLRVLNYANKGQVNGRPLGTEEDSFFPLIATIPDPEKPSKLMVGPDIGVLPGTQQLGKGNYWVVAVGDGHNRSMDGGGSYSWAIVIGGAPGRATDYGCATGSGSSFLRRFQVNNIGLWFFSRQPEDDDALEALMESALDMGLDTTLLVSVAHAGCLYLSPEQYAADNKHDSP